MIFFTIVARNYLAMAATLHESIATFHPDSRLIVVLLDDEPAPTEYGFLEVVPAKEMVGTEEFNFRRCYYDLLELSTSIKARCFAYLFAQGEERCVYLDPDICLFSRLDEVERNFDAGVLCQLTPHLLAPLPDDGESPDDLAVLRSGTYNLGFLALLRHPETNAFLTWWDEKLANQCLRDISLGVFTDQKWMEFAPAFIASTSIIRHAGYNAAYWNLPGRPIRQVEGAWLAGGHALAFFHFSGFDPGQPGQLSKHDSRTGPATGALARLLDWYAQKLNGFGHSNAVRLPFSPPRFSSGARWDPICRGLFRAKTENGRRRFDPLGDPAFTAWMAGNAPHRELPRYVEELFRQRGDVAEAYGPAERRGGLRTWLEQSGTRELGIDPKLLQALGLATPRRRSVTRANYVGYLGAHLGIGEAARGYAGALIDAGVPTNLVDVSKYGPGANPYPLLERHGLGEADPAAEVTIWHVNADQLPSVMAANPRAVARRNVAVWAWETGAFPEEWRNRFDLVDEIWVASRLMADAIAPVAPCPVLVIPYVVSVPDIAADRNWLPAGTPEEFIFLTQFDYRSIPHRKNPEATIEAFQQAFPADEPVRLIVKTMHADGDLDHYARLRALATDPRILFWDAALDTDERYRLLASVDCFVSLHRAEGFGLSLAEAMAYGKLVIATGWSGNMDFMTQQNSVPVPFRMVPLSRDHGPYARGTLWAEPDVGAAAAAMRRAFEDREWSQSLAEQARVDVGNQLAAAGIAGRMRDRLELTLMRSQPDPKPSAAHRAPALSLRNQAALAAFVLRHPGAGIKSARLAWRYFRQFGWRALWARASVRGHEIRQRGEI